MPLTISHPAAVLPLRRLGLPATVLVIASMVPDIPLFMSWDRGYEASHSLVGIVTGDLAVTLAIVAGWFAVLRDALVDLAPASVRARLAVRVRLTAREWVMTPVAAVIGALTHVVWDSFTHPGRWGVDRIGWLQTEHAGLLGHQWAQYASGVLGLVIVIISVAAHLRAAPVLVDDRPPRRLPALTLPVVVGVAAMAALVSAVWSVPSGLHVMAFNSVIDSLIVLVVGLVGVGIAWRLAAPRPARTV